MAFFNNEIVSEGFSLPTNNGYTFEGTMTESEDICREFVETSYTLESGMYIADSMIERAVYEGYGDVESLVENALTDMIDRVKNAIMKLWKKITDWITKTKDNLRLYINANQKWVAKNASSLKKKLAANKDFKYTGYKFSKTANDDALDLISTNITSDTIRKNVMTATGHEPTTADVLSYIIKDSSAVTDKSISSVAELGDFFTKKFNGSDETIENIVPSDSDLQGWLDEIKAAKKTTEGIRKAESKAKETISKSIKKLDEAKKSAKKIENKETRGEEVGKINATIKVANFESSLVSKLVTVVINNNMRMYKQYNTVCKSINALSAKDDKKDGDKASTETDKNSIFSAALGYFG